MEPPPPSSSSLPPPLPAGGSPTVGYAPPASFLTPAERAAQDAEHLRLLVIFHYVVGVLIALAASLFLVHFFIGLMMVANPQWLQSNTPGRPSQGPPAFFGYLFAGIGAAAVLGGWAVAALTIFCGRCIRARRRRLFTLTMAGVNCLHFPFGTALGVFTFLVLLRPSVEALYARPALTAEGAPPTAAA